MRSVCSFLILFGAALFLHGCHIHVPGGTMGGAYSRCVEPDGCPGCGTGIYGTYANPITRARSKRIERMREQSFLRNGDSLSRRRRMNSALAGYDMDAELYGYDLYGGDDYGFGDQLADGWMPTESYVDNFGGELNSQTGCNCNGGGTSASSGSAGMGHTVTAEHGNSGWGLSEYINDGWHVVEPNGSTTPTPMSNPMPSPMPMNGSDGDIKAVPEPMPSTDAYYTPRLMPTLAPIPESGTNNNASSGKPLQPVLWVPAGL